MINVNLGVGLWPTVVVNARWWPVPIVVWLN